MPWLPGFILGIFLISLCLWTGPAQATTTNWTDTTGNWSNGNNWSSFPNPPASGDDVQIFNSTFPATLTITYDNPNGGVQTFHSFALDATGASTGVILSQTGAFTLQSLSETVGLNGSAGFTQSGGTNAVTNDLHIGSNSGSSGSYTLSGTGSLAVGNNDYLGDAGTGAFTQTGGTQHVIGSLILGNQATGSGTYTLSGGSLLTFNEGVGSSGTGSFTQSGGSHTVTNILTLAANSGSSGTFALKGGSLTTTIGVNLP